MISATSGQDARSVLGLESPGHADHGLESRGHDGNDRHGLKRLCHRGAQVVA
jgi:hypothetical protein